MRPNSLSKESDREIRDFILEIYLYLAAEHDAHIYKPSQMLLRGV